MPTALLTGITGQDGAYLAQFLLERGYDQRSLSPITSAEAERRSRPNTMKNWPAAAQGSLTD